MAERKLMKLSDHLDMPTFEELCSSTPQQGSNEQFHVVNNDYLIESLSRRPDLMVNMFTKLRDALNATEFEVNCHRRPQTMATLLLSWQRELARSTMHIVNEARKNSTDK